MGLKSFFGKVGRKITGTISVIVNGLEEIFSRVFHFPDLIFGWLLESLYSKKIRLTVIILTKPDGTLTTTEAQVVGVIDHAKKTLQAGANINFEKSDIKIIEEPAPSYVLRVEGGINVFGDIFQAAGEYFRSNSQSGHLTAFVIDDVIGAVGYTPALTDYFLIDDDGIRRGSTLVHEIGHACGLFHWNSSDNFMKTPSSIKVNRVNWFQSNILRSSRHVGYS